MQPGEHDRWESLYASYSEPVFVYARRHVGADEAADIVAETFLVAWRRIDMVPNDALPWLFAAAKNVINNARRAETRRGALRRRLASVGAIEAEPDPAEEIEARTDIVAAMRFLPKPEREALVLVAWEDLDPRRAAAAMGCSPETFAVRVHRGRRRLMKILSSGVPERGVAVGARRDDARGPS